MEYSPKPVKIQFRKIYLDMLKDKNSKLKPVVVPKIKEIYMT